MRDVEREALPFAEATEVSRRFWRVIGWQLNSGPMVAMSQHLNGGTLAAEEYPGGDVPLDRLLATLWRVQE